MKHYITKTLARISAYNSDFENSPETKKLIRDIKDYIGPEGRDWDAPLLEAFLTKIFKFKATYNPTPSTELQANPILGGAMIMSNFLSAYHDELAAQSIPSQHNDDLSLIFLQIADYDTQNAQKLYDEYSRITNLEHNKVWEYEDYDYDYETENAKMIQTLEGIIPQA